MIAKVADQIDELEVWDLTPVPVPERSALYSLHPIGLETLYVESMTSYLSRLAAAHCLVPLCLLDEILGPQIATYKPSRGVAVGSIPLDASGGQADATLQALEALTKRTDLRPLTLSIWGTALDTRGMLRETKAWCPVCYKEWSEAGKVIYSPLLWAFKDITHCVRHRQRLRTTCSYPDCARSFRPLSVRPALPGHCTHCRRWLGRSPELPTASGTELIWQQWLTKAIGELLANSTIVSSPPTSQRVSDVLTNLIRRTCEGKTTIFAQVVKFPEKSVKQWVRGEFKPRLAAALRICFEFRLTLADLLVHDPETLSVPSVEYIDRSHTRRSSRYLESTKANLTQALQEAAASDDYPPASLQETAHRLNCKDSFLRRCDPDACHTIIARYQAYLHCRHEQHVQEACDDVRRVARQLRSQGLSLSKKRVTRHLSHPSMIRLPKVYDAYRQVCEELESAGDAPM